MQAILGHLDLPPLSIWTGAWMGRAGLLAEFFSFFLIAPEILGPERLRGVEEALRKGLGSRHVVWGVILLLTAYLAVLSLVPVVLVLIFGRSLSHPAKGALLAVIFASAISDEVCRLAVAKTVPLVRRRHAIEIVKRMARVNWDLLNPLAFGGTARTSILQWMLWILGIPFHILGVVPFLILPAITLWLLGLAQKVLSGGASLRTFVFGTGALMLLGGIAAQIVTTF